MRQEATPPPLASVLVVDDEPGIREFLALLLGELGYRVRTAPDGEAALTVLAEERPDVVVTDLMMPRLSGWELCARLRQDPATRTLPLIVMSAVAGTGVAADAVLRKPFATDELLAVLQRLTAAGGSGAARAPEPAPSVTAGRAGAAPRPDQGGCAGGSRHGPAQPAAAGGRGRTSRVR